MTTDGLIKLIFRLSKDTLWNIPSSPHDDRVTQQALCRPLVAKESSMKSSNVIITFYAEMNLVNFGSKALDYLRHGVSVLDEIPLHVVDSVKLGF